MSVLLRNDFGGQGFSETKVVKVAEDLLLLAKKTEYELSILLTDDPAIQEINVAWRQKDKATNVLSFPMEDDDAILPMLGDIVISIDTAQREALHKKHPLPHYLTRLLVHGFVHLLGYDHEKSAKAYAEMHAIEQDYLHKLGEL